MFQTLNLDHKIGLILKDIVNIDERMSMMETMVETLNMQASQEIRGIGDPTAQNSIQ